MRQVAFFSSKIVTETRRIAAQRFLRKLKNKKIFAKELDDKVYPSGHAVTPCSGSKPVSIDGLLKYHKKKNVQRNNLSLRLIISFIRTYNYYLSKFFTNLLDPFFPTFQSTKDSFTFCEGIRKVSATNTFLISWNVCSFFTSMPLKETSDIAVNLLFEYNSGLNITKAELKKKFQFATSDTYFLFQGTFYDQVDGFVMCSPPGINL